LAAGDYGNHRQNAGTIDKSIQRRSDMTQTYTLIIKNGYCAGSWASNGSIGGLALDNNSPEFPESVLGLMCHWAEKDESGSVELRLNLTLNFNKAEVDASPLLSTIFDNRFRAEVEQRFSGPNPLDQRPAIRCQALFPHLLAFLSGKWQKITPCFDQSLIEDKWIDIRARFTAELEFKGQDAISVFALCMMPL
jgi:hypothetical protein